ncbi:GTPase-associated protein 1-related protein [Streptomyces sp. NPDC006193]|uniref:GTPase-associated protein 1-related protein n=1 Tax=Streptomyces sp. NPDC006193 TaxID=3155717 RepID=UPI0033B58513
MSLAQLHYTSAPPGPDGSGFRFTAVSPGVPAAVLREAEQLIGYEPPRDLPDRPDAEQLKSFPKAFSCTELSDGGLLLSRSVYTGADYSGRWGNFHAHAVHLPPGARLPDGVLPITAWESPRWADATPPGGRPEPVDRFEPSGLLRRDSLVAFARSRAGRLAAFFADLRTLAEGGDARQIVLVERDSADVARWIALACAVLPRERAHRLTFTTYTRRPQQARQQIVGALPSSEPVGHDHRFRVHDCTGLAAGEPVADAWADVCARIWTAGRPELFRAVPRAAGDTALGAGPLAAAALAEGVPLRPDGRAAAARWTAAHASALPEHTLAALVAELSREPGAGVGGSTAQDAAGSAGDHAGAGDDEPAAVAELLARLDGQVPTAVSAPLAARALATAVRGRGPMPALRAGSLTPEVRAALARDLAPVLRHGIAGTAGPATGRPLALLHVADLLDVDCTDLLPGFAGRVARELVSADGARSHEAQDAAGDGPRAPAAADGTGPAPAPAPAPPAAARSGHVAPGAARPRDTRPAPAPDDTRPGCPPALLDALDAHPALRTALFGALDALAAAHPAAVAGRLAGSGLPVASAPGFPHLRMCVLDETAGRFGGDRLGRFHRVLRSAAVSPHAEPTVLRTAFRLVWPGELPTGEEAGLLLNELGSDAHRLAGTRDLLVAAALAAPPEDAAVPLLAADLLRCFTAELAPAHRAPLLLLEFAGLLGTDGEGENWVERVRALRDGAVEPVPDRITRRVYDALGRRLLAVPVPESELYALARSGDADLLAAYERAAHGAAVADRLRTAPSYLAARFCDWSAYPDTHPAWEATRTALLTEVLRPVVRALPAEDRTAVEEALRRTGRGRLDAYRAWNRPGALGRLAGRLTGRGRREDRQAAWYGDVQPPADGGAR